MSQLAGYAKTGWMLLSKIRKFWLPLVASALAVTPMAAPVLAPGHPLTALLIHDFFSRLCHQEASRSFLLNGSPVAVCVRCLGIYWGVALGLWLRPSKFPAIAWLLMTLLINVFDVGTGMLHWHGDMPVPRFLLGLAVGLGAGAMLGARRGLEVEQNATPREIPLFSSGRPPCPR